MSDRESIPSFSFTFRLSLRLSPLPSLHKHTRPLENTVNVKNTEMLPTTKIMKNYPRCFPVTEEMVESWTSCSYIGETTRTHDEILELGE